MISKWLSVRLDNKDKFDKIHRLRPKPIPIGNQLIVFNNTIDHQYSTLKFFSRKWFYPYVVSEMHNNETYSLAKLDRTPLKSKIAKKKIKFFERRDGQVYAKDLLDFEAQKLNQE